MCSFTLTAKRQVEASMLLDKNWIESRVQQMSEIEAKKSLAPATKEFLVEVIRLSKGILSAFDRWLKRN
jgi:hypothetical protein